MTSNEIELIATAPMGLEAVVAREVRDLGYDRVTVENGRVTFIGDTLAICRANLWLRTSDRVLVKMGAFPARTFDELFEGSKRCLGLTGSQKTANFRSKGVRINHS
ncbi:THUMP domain-containing protein [Paenibacillus sp. P26]|nr:THUMP domain-containing protein [Paenibacillus sp. P26]